MRSFLALAALLTSPALAAAPPLCAMPDPALTPVADQQPPAPLAPVPPPAPQAALAPTPLSGALAAIPFAQHVAAAGAVINDLGASHGLQSFAARSSDSQFIIFQVAPDGQAAVSGAMIDLTPVQLTALAGDSITDLGVQHGLQGLFVRNGQQFQVFYVTPDRERVIPGVLWDAAGKDLTRQQVANIPGAIPTVVVGGADPGQTNGPATAAAALPLMQKANFGTVGPASAPRLWMLVDPQCIYSVRAMQMLQPFVASGRVQLSVVPLSVLDYEDQGASTKSALALLSKPAEQLVSAWLSRDLAGAVAPDANSRLQANMGISQAIQLRGTPTFVWRKTDGTEGRIDGMPTNVEALIASIGS